MCPPIRPPYSVLLTGSCCVSDADPVSWSKEIEEIIEITEITEITEIAEIAGRQPAV